MVATKSAATALILAWTSCGSGEGSSSQRVEGDACLPLDVIALLNSDMQDDVSKQCGNIIYPKKHAPACKIECFEAMRRFQEARCYPALTQPQRNQPRVKSETLVGMQGVWYGIYQSNGIELVEAVYEAEKGVLRGTKLAGNHFVRAGRITWEASESLCHVVSSKWAGVYTPQWDPCKFTIIDSDNFIITLPLGGGEEEILPFVRASLPLLLDWDEPGSPLFGFGQVMGTCGLEIDETGQSFFSELMSWFHHSANTVIIDQALLLLPLLMLGGWQAAGPQALSPWIFVPLSAAYCMLLTARLNYLGYLS